MQVRLLHQYCSSILRVIHLECTGAVQVTSISLDLVFIAHLVEQTLSGPPWARYKIIFLYRKSKLPLDQYHSATVEGGSDMGGSTTDLDIGYLLLAEHWTWCKTCHTGPFEYPNTRRTGSLVAASRPSPLVATVSGRVLWRAPTLGNPRT